MRAGGEGGREGREGGREGGREVSVPYHLSLCQSSRETSGHVAVATAESQKATLP